METVVTVAVIAALIAVGVLVIHRLNAQHGNRVSALRYGDTPPGQRPLRHHRALARWRPGRRANPDRGRRG
ncbi:hypothetical protein ABT174_11415 [Streptomyces sparsogenes]|uniref:hypothetical protein n=1 Tax=Streptomyces sparsogenes TaxID=67365 RepID=UPI0033177C0B